jgi:hypothetical protein
MSLFEKMPQIDGRVISKAAMLPDTANDLIAAKLRRFNQIRTWNGTKRRMREELDHMCDLYGYFGFEADPRDYAAHIVGQSFLYDVPENKRGRLYAFRSRRVRIICLYSGTFRRWLRVGAIAAR